jgi:hypothetical protein
VPPLSDYIGALLAEITNARVQADLESARIAQLYASHPLLQHFAVPRMRLPNVSLDLPVAVDKVDPPAGSPHSAELPAVRQKLDSIIQQELARVKLQLTPSLRKRLADGLGEIFKKLQGASTLSAKDIVNAADQASSATMDVIAAATKEPETMDPTIEPSIRRQFAAEFLKLQPAPSQVQVSVITAQLKDVAPSQILTRIHLAISEEGVEWTQTNPSDPASKTLLPE